MTEKYQEVPPLAVRAVRKARRILTAHAANEADGGHATKARKVCTVGVSHKQRSRLQRLNPDVTFEHFSFRKFLPPDNIKLPPCDSLIMNMEYRNQDLLDQAAEAGIETYSLHLVLKTSLAEVKSYADVDMEELFAPAGTVHVSTEDAGATLSEKLAFVEEQIKAGNRQPEFLEVFKTIVFEILRQPDNSPFLTWLRRYMNYRWEGEPFSEDMFETYNSAFQKVREKGLVAPNNFFATFAAMLASSGQYDRMRSAIEMLPTTANLDGYLLSLIHI